MSNTAADRDIMDVPGYFCATETSNTNMSHTDTTSSFNVGPNYEMEDPTLPKPDGANKTDSDFSSDDSLKDPNYVPDDDSMDVTGYVCATETSNPNMSHTVSTSSFSVGLNNEMEDPTLSKGNA